MIRHPSAGWGGLEVKNIREWLYLDRPEITDLLKKCLWLDTVHRLACGIASVINTVDPQIVVLGGGIARAGEALFEPLASFMDAVEWRPHGHRVAIVPARLGAYAGAMGAAYNAILHAVGET